MEYIPESTQKHINDLVRTINKLNKERNKLTSENKDLKEQLRIGSVSQQRELLIDFLDDVLMCQDEGATIVDREKYVDGYLGN